MVEVQSEGKAAAAAMTVPTTFSNQKLPAKDTHTHMQREKCATHKEEQVNERMRFWKRATNSMKNKRKTKNLIEFICLMTLNRILFA